MTMCLKYNGKHYVTLNQYEWKLALEQLETALTVICLRLKEDNIKRKQSGICAALMDAHAPHHARKIADWLMHQWPEACESLDYPVEGHAYLYEVPDNKWGNNLFGAKRRRLLKYLIDSVKELRS